MATAQPLAAPIRAAVYCRISRDDAGDMLGVRRQEKDARALCARKHWTVTEVFTDDDLSAWSGKERPAYLALLDAITAGSFDAVVAYDLDRLHRLPRELEAFFDVCDHAGLTLMATVSGDVDLATNDGRLVARIMGAVAKKSSDDTSRRLRRKNDEKAEAGLPHGARAFGYQADGVTVDELEAELLRQAVADLLAGESLNAIARRWNDAGIVTPQRSRPWSGTVVRSVLSNPRQAGLRVHRGEVVGPGVWPAIIDRATHDRVVAVLNDPGRRRRTPPRRKEFTGLIRCARCGQPMDRDTVRGTVTYRCHKRPGRDNCGGMSIAGVRLDEVLVEAVLQRLDGPDLAQRIRDTERGGESKLSAELQCIEGRKTELAELYAAGDIGRGEWMTAKKALEDRERAAKAGLARLTGTAALDPFIGKPGALRAAWGDLTVDRQRSVLAAVIDRVLIKPATKRGRGFDLERIDVVWRV